MEVTKKILPFIFTVDDGGIDDMRLGELMHKHNIPGLFYLPNVSDISEGDIRILHEKFGMQIGGHTVSHPADLKQCSDEELAHEIGENKRWLEEVIGEPIKHFAYPRGRYNLEVIDHVEHAGYETARTTLVLCVDQTTDKMRTHTTIHLYPRKEYRGVDMFTLAKEYAESIADSDTLNHPKVFHMWCHSKDLNTYHLWERLEEFFVYLNENFTLKPSI